MPEAWSGMSSGTPLAWGLSETFAVVVFVIIGIFAVLLVARIHVEDIPDICRNIVAKFRGDAAQVKASDGDEQFPNEVRLGDDTLEFADGVPAHDGTDDEDDEDDNAEPNLLKRISRFFSRNRHHEEDTSLDSYQGDDPFTQAASRHGQAAETSLDDERGTTQGHAIRHGACHGNVICDAADATDVAGRACGGVGQRDRRSAVRG